MRSHAPALLPIFRSQHQATLLAWLLLHPGDEYSLTDLARRLQVPLTTIQREVDRLVEAGLLRDRLVGRSRLIRSNDGNRATVPLSRLLELSFGPEVVIGEEFAIPGAHRVLIFGSWAKRYNGAPGAPPNDIDVLVIGTVNRADVYEAADRAQERLGLEVNPVIRSSQEWADGTDPLIIEVKASDPVDVTASAAL